MKMDSSSFLKLLNSNSLSFSTGTLQTATNVAAPGWIDAPSQSNPQTVPTTGTQLYFRIKQ